MDKKAGCCDGCPCPTCACTCPYCCLLDLTGRLQTANVSPDVAAQVACTMVNMMCCPAAKDD